MQNTNYTQDNPFFARLKLRERLSHPESEKETQHVVLDLTGSNLTYQVGDCIAMCPSNSAEHVHALIEKLQASAHAIVTTRQGENCTLFDLLTKKAHLAKPTRALIELIHTHAPSALTEELLQDKEKMRLFLSENDVLDILSLSTTSLPLPAFCQTLSPLNPRYYSIASAQSHVGDNEVHLLIIPLKYTQKQKTKIGVCSRYICELPIDGTVPVFIHPHRGFTLPQDHQIPIIMIGPGTGVAPFRAFMQERYQAQAKGKNWLFFGEWKENHNFFYRPFWEQLEQEGHLKLTTAFSRDNAHKVYVQHKMEEHSNALMQWLEEGAHLYVCGDAERMAKDVEQTLLTIIAKEKQCSAQEALHYVKNLRKEKRYLRDVY